MFANLTFDLYQNLTNPKAEEKGKTLDELGLK